MQPTAMATAIAARDIVARMIVIHLPKAEDYVSIRSASGRSTGSRVLMFADIEGKLDALRVECKRADAPAARSREVDHDLSGWVAGVVGRVGAVTAALICLMSCCINLTLTLTGVISTGG